MTTYQKTWIQLLGCDQRGANVSGCDIVRRIGKDQYKVLWHFDTNKQSRSAFAAWCSECTPFITGD